MESAYPKKSAARAKHTDVSAFYDHIDDIYLDMDPIEASLKQRKNKEIPKNMKKLCFYFALKWKSPQR